MRFYDLHYPHPVLTLMLKCLGFHKSTAFWEIPSPLSSLELFHYICKSYPRRAGQLGWYLSFDSRKGSCFLASPLKLHNQAKALASTTWFSMLKQARKQCESWEYFGGVRKVPIQIQWHWAPWQIAVQGIHLHFYFTKVATRKKILYVAYGKTLQRSGHQDSF